VPADIGALCDDLVAERAALDAVLASLDPGTWAAPTPSVGWTVLDQVTHLAYFDGAARLAIDDPDAFRADREQAADVAAFVDSVTDQSRSVDSGRARAWLREAGAALVAAARAAPADLRVPWYGPDMSLASTITARIMETWAHGLDITDTLGIVPNETPRLRHVAFIGATAFANSFVSHGRPVPAERVRVVLDAPGGGTWTFGPPAGEGADDNSVSGSALDFCLVVTQRRHRDDTALVAVGPVADEWLSIAQAFAGPAGPGRPRRGERGGS
jgi:uncharacterized protein (TIGR03084 family)